MTEEVKNEVATAPEAQQADAVAAVPFVGAAPEAALPVAKPPQEDPASLPAQAVEAVAATTEIGVVQEPLQAEAAPQPSETDAAKPVKEETTAPETSPAAAAPVPAETDVKEEPAPGGATLTPAVAANPSAPSAAGGNIVWRLQYVPVLQPPMGENGDASTTNIPQPFSVGANQPVVAEATKGQSEGEKKEGGAVAADGEGNPTEIVTNASAIPAAAPGTTPANAIPAAIPQGAPGTVFPQFIVAPSNAQFIAPSTGSSQPAQYVLAPNFPQARISNDPNNGIWNLTLEDSTDLPLPLEDEVDLSCYNYKINLGKDVVSGKGGKVQQLNRHFRNMVAAAYPTYDATSSKISKRKIGLKIYQTIIDRGGRFLDLDGKPMDRPKSILKVMKALKDAKTWTSDAKRLAKRKRDEQKNREAQQEMAKKARLTQDPVAAVKEDPVAVAAVAAAVAAVDVVNKSEIEEAADSKIPATNANRMLPTQSQKKDEATPEGEGEKPTEQGNAPEAAQAEPTGEQPDPDAVLQGLELLTKAAAQNTKPKESEVQNTMQV
mmetsp:Transcript_2491/g.5433  ORF Transcript_2491/g.5433 Transcript_2491/m.5433 type:complete len:548 (-) Transcript_2491:19-1662(-)